MKYTVITTFHDEGLKQYGQRMIDTFEKFWPAEVDLIVCAENCSPTVQRENTKVIDLLSASSELRTFLERHKNNPYAHGQAGPPDVFSPKKQFRWDAVRFCYKVYAVALCAQEVKSGMMIWVDADTVTHSPITIENLAQLAPSGSMITYLGRGEQYHSECGWVGYNLDHPNTTKFINDFVGMYNNDTIFNQPEWHDSFIWDIVRRQYQPTNKFFNLNPKNEVKGIAGHPFINSKLGLYMDHVKGARKQAGMSKPKDIVVHKNHPYWQRVIREQQ